MPKYTNQNRYLVAVDCIVFGYDGQKINLLLIKRGFEPEKNKWSLMGGFIEPNESADEAATRVLHKLTGIKGLYLEPLQAFTNPNRDPIERTISLAYFALIDIHQYQKQMTHEYHAEWMPLNELPILIFDHRKMVNTAKKQLQYKSALHPILFELLPEKFTLPVLINLFEAIFDTSFDKRNFSRKMLSTGLLKRLEEKDRAHSKKGAYFYTLDKKSYQQNFHKILPFIPNPNKLI